MDKTGRILNFPGWYYTDETAVPKTVYDYAVRPYRKLGSKISLGDYSSTGYVCQTAIPKVSLTSVTEQDGGVTVNGNTRLMSPATLFIVQTIRTVNTVKF